MIFVNIIHKYLNIRRGLRYDKEEIWMPLSVKWNVFLCFLGDTNFLIGEGWYKVITSRWIYMPTLLPKIYIKVIAFLT